MVKAPVTLKRFLVAMAGVTLLAFSPLIRSQNAPQSGAGRQATQTEAPDAEARRQAAAGGHVYPEPVDYWKQAGKVPKKPFTMKGPAPIHDISGVWDPGDAGIEGGGFGVLARAQLPYTPAGLEAMKSHKSASTVVPTESNDPAVKCDPQGMPREDLQEFRTIQVFQTPIKIAILYTFNRIWRDIWLDGRELPKNPEPRWYGYSVGKWVDDTTLQVETAGLDDRTWVDQPGHPHSDQLRVEETFHRTDRGHLQMSLKVDDPKMYTKPWFALNKMLLELQPDDFDVREFICSPSEGQEYNDLLEGPQSGK